MNAVVFYGKHDVRLEQCAAPHAQAGQVLVQVHACGVCGTDVHIFNGDKGSTDTTPPTILGHEFAGIVTEVGDSVTGFSVGDRVAVDPNILCGSCYYCKNGAGHFCEQLAGIGTTLNGGFAQYVAVPASQACRIADHTSFVQGAMAEPVACCLHGMDLCGVKPGMQVAVIGGGMIGLIMLQLARISGAAKLVLLEPVAAKRDMASRLGADIIIDPVRKDVEAVLAQSGVKQLDVVIECVGHKDTMQQAIALAGRAATVMFFGLCAPDDEIPVKPFELFQKEITLKASFINPNTMQRAVALIDSGKLDVTSMVKPLKPLSELGEILASAELRKLGKLVIGPQLDSGVCG